MHHPWSKTALESTKVHLQLRILQIPKRPQPNHSAQNVSMPHILVPVHRTTQLVQVGQSLQPAIDDDSLPYSEEPCVLQMVKLHCENVMIDCASVRYLIPKTHPIAFLFFSDEFMNQMLILPSVTSRLIGPAVTYRLDTQDIWCQSSKYFGKEIGNHNIECLMYLCNIRLRKICC